MSERPLQEEDALPTRRVALVLVTLAILALGCVLYAALLMRTREHALDRGTARLHPALAPEGANRLPTDRALFRRPRQYSDEWLTPLRRRLEGWGWVDRDKGIVHIPIEKAMEIVAQEGSK